MQIILWLYHYNETNSLLPQISSGHYDTPYAPPPDYDKPYIPPPDYTPPSKHRGVSNGKTPQMNGNANYANGRITPISS